MQNYFFYFSKVCTPPMCNEEGIYVSDYCQKNGFNECALMITGFPGKNVKNISKLLVVKKKMTTLTKLGNLSFYVLL